MQLDHIFVCTAVGAPAASRLIEAGIPEGPPNTHPGQGTACRRFFFHNAMLELVWVADEAEARQSPTGLWDRWNASVNLGKTSPFGVILAFSTEDEFSAAPFPHWEYRPETMPGLRLWIASESGLAQPMLCLMPMVRPSGQRATGKRNLTRACIHSPAQVSIDHVDWIQSPEHWLELEFDNNAEGKLHDFRPDLPVVISL